MGNAVRIGESLGIDDSVIGLTIVAAGTSIPDVMASVVAARRQEHLIAIGNLLGSNIFNILVVLSATLLVSGKGLVFTDVLLIDYVAVGGLSLLFAVSFLSRRRLDIPLGIVLLALYAAYYVYRIGWAA